MVVFLKIEAGNVLTAVVKGVRGEFLHVGIDEAHRPQIDPKGAEAGMVAEVFVVQIIPVLLQLPDKALGVTGALLGKPNLGGVVDVPHPENVGDQVDEIPEIKGILGRIVGFLLSEGKIFGGEALRTCLFTACLEVGNRGAGREL